MAKDRIVLKLERPNERMSDKSEGIELLLDELFFVHAKCPIPMRIVTVDNNNI